MPHLSPMNWLLALLSIWFIMFMLMSISWWSTNSSWPNLTHKSSNSTKSTWSWML